LVIWEKAIASKASGYASADALNVGESQAESNAESGASSYKSYKSQIAYQRNGEVRYPST
jgi:hypothetical protein